MNYAIAAKRMEPVCPRRASLQTDATAPMQVEPGITERAFSMRIQVRTFVLVLCLGAACSDDHERDHRPRDAGAERTDADAGPPPLVDVVRSEVELYDRRIRAVCPCLVEQGQYATEEECLKLGASGPDWVECATMALESYDSAETRAQSQCYFEFLEEAAECVEASKCDTEQLTRCATPDLDCLTVVNERLNLVLTACPDFGLLSRVSP
jgi:hypothetical protein